MFFFYFQDIDILLCFAILLYFIIVICIILFIVFYYVIFSVVFYYFIQLYFACKTERHSYSCLPLVKNCSALFNFNVISFILYYFT